MTGDHILMQSSDNTGPNARTLDNVEGNVETPLLGEDLDSTTPLWQHDRAAIRWPALVIRWLVLFVRRNFWPLVFAAILVVSGVLTAISLSRGGFPLIPLMVLSFDVIAMTIYSRVS